MIRYVFDGTLKGLLTAIFEYYEKKDHEVKIVSQANYEAEIFSQDEMIYSDDEKSKRVWDGLKLKISTKHLNEFYSAFLSEDSQIFQDLFEYARYVFDHSKGADQNFGNQFVLSIAQTARKVHREKHRMEAFIRFQKSANGLYYALISPDFNVLPLIVKHFKNRYADQQWVIYDEKRKYGISYDLNSVTEVTFEVTEISKELSLSDEILIDPKESLYEKLWQGYFKSTNIKERKNMKLHLQHVPKRYWRYLTEKKR